MLRKKTVTVVMYIFSCALMLTLINHMANETEQPACNINSLAKHMAITKPVNELEMSKQVANIPAEIQDEMLGLNEQKVSYDNPRLVTLIRDYFIYPPSKEPYNLTQPNRIDYAGQGKVNVLPTILKDVPEGGFFIECGAFDGETYSHSLYFEKTKHWSGLLVEAGMDNFKTLLQKHRKAFSLNACISSSTYPSVMSFNQFDAFGRLVQGTFDETYKHHKNYKLKKGMTQLQCFPLYSVLLALNQVHVDFFALDIEGMELPILRTLPWDKVNITYILAEYTHSQGGHSSYKSYLEENGYEIIRVIGEDVLAQTK